MADKYYPRPNAKGKPKSDEHRKAMSRAATGKAKSEEHCKNMSAAITLWWAKRRGEL